MENLEQLLARHPFFEGISEEQVAFIAGCGRNAQYKPGAMLFREGTPANELYVVREGVVRVEIASPKLGPVAIHTVHAGDVVGWSWLIPPYFWHFDGRAVDSVRVTVLDGKCLRGKLENDTALGFALMRRFSGILEARLQSTRLQLIEALEAAAEKDAR
jgi:CRP/FNR family transcriptional regulator, cyclic AMP receptor protein